MDDAIVLQNFIDGNDAAFIIIYNKYIDPLLSYGLGLGFNEEILKDAIQDVFIKLYSHRRQLKEVKNLKFYLFRSLKNRLLDLHKSSVEMCKVEDYCFHFALQTTALDNLIEKEDNDIMHERIEHFLSSLTDRQRECIYLRFFNEMEYEDIAKLLNITTHASRKLISRAIKKIRTENAVACL